MNIEHLFKNIGYFLIAVIGLALIVIVINIIKEKIEDRILNDKFDDDRYYFG